MDVLLSQVNTLIGASAGETKAKMMVQLRDLLHSLENEDDTFHRLGYLVRDTTRNLQGLPLMTRQPLQTSATRIGFNLSLFKLLVDVEKPVNAEWLANRTGAQLAFMRRYMNYLGSIGHVKEMAKDEYQANNVTRNLAIPMVEAGVSHCFENIGLQYQALPAYFEEHQYKCPTDPMHTAFQYAFKADVHQFAWFSDHPENLALFNDFMALRRTAEQSWLAVYPVEEKSAGWDATTPLYVNMGGGIGHQCAQFKKKYPHVAGRVILQDMPHSIANALPTPGVENMAHNFFEPQPVEGARFYFLRGVLHNHPDDKVLIVLKNIVAAMSSESILLLDELVLPETGISEYGAALDLTMMAAFASIERTEAQWRKLFQEAGLTIQHLYPYNPVVYENVMELKKL